MRILAATLLVAGCSYEHGWLEPQPDASGTVDDPVPGLDGGSGSADNTPRACKYPDPSLRLCLEFDDRHFAPVVHDASAYRVDAISTNVSEWPRNGTPAAGFDYGSDLRVPETPNLDLTGAFTIEVWVLPAYPQSAPLVRNIGQYQMVIDGQGGVSCSIGNSGGGAYVPNKVGWSWTHVACTYDNERLRVWIDGVGVGCQKTESTMTTSGTTGTQFVPGWVGALDEIRIYGRALADNEMCGHAGKSSCASASSCD